MGIIKGIELTLDDENSNAKAKLSHAYTYLSESSESLMHELYGNQGDTE